MPSSEKTKNLRLHVPEDLYRRIKKRQAQRVLDDMPEKSIAHVCIDLLYQATDSQELQEREDLYTDKQKIL